MLLFTRTPYKMHPEHDTTILLFRCPVSTCKRTFKEHGRKLAVHVCKMHSKLDTSITEISAPELRYISYKF